VSEIVSVALAGIGVKFAARACVTNDLTVVLAELYITDKNVTSTQVLNGDTPSHPQRMPMLRACMHPTRPA